LLAPDELENASISAVNYLKESGNKAVEIDENQSIDDIFEVIKSNCLQT